MYIIKSNFSNYRNIYEGSVLYQTKSKVYIQMSTFVNNSADIGGVMNIIDDNVLSISDSVFDRNTAFISSGCIEASSNSNITSQNNIFKNNNANIQGVLFIKVSSNFADSGSFFINNTATNQYPIGYATNLKS